jgi:hypothetical protein
LRGSDEKPFVAQPRAATMNDGPTTASRNTEEDNSEKKKMLTNIFNPENYLCPCE